MKRYLVVVFAMLGLGLPASAHAQSTRAQLKDAQAKVVGTATLSEVPGGVRVTLRVNGLKPGEHGFLDFGTANYTDCPVRPFVIARYTNLVFTLPQGGRVRGKNVSITENCSMSISTLGQPEPPG